MSVGRMIMLRSIKGGRAFGKVQLRPLGEETGISARVRGLKSGMLVLMMGEELQTFPLSPFREGLSYEGRGMLRRGGRILCAVVEEDGRVLLAGESNGKAENWVAVEYRLMKRFAKNRGAAASDSAEGEPDKGPQKEMAKQAEPEPMIEKPKEEPAEESAEDAPPAAEERMECAIELPAGEEGDAQRGEDAPELQGEGAEEDPPVHEPLPRERPRTYGARSRGPTAEELPGMEHWQWEQVDLTPGEDGYYYLGTRYDGSGNVDGRAVAIPKAAPMPAHAMRGFSRVGQCYVLAQDKDRNVLTPREF